MIKLFRHKQIPNLTPIRFPLALLIIISHVSEFSMNRGFPSFNNLPIFHKGSEAVHFFFTMSGFLIINQLFEQKNITGTINLRGFYLKRILRIFPIYYLVLFFGFLYYHQILPFFGYDYENGYDLLSGILLSATFFSNIFRTLSPGGILEILWSTSIQEQFYLLIAPIILIIPVKRIVMFLGLFTTIYFIIFFSESIEFLYKYSMTFYYFSFGGLCSILLKQNNIQSLIKKIQYPVLLIFVVYFSTDIFRINFHNILYNFFSIAILGLTISVLSIKPIKIIENRTMNYLGKISYGIYMYHVIIIQFIGLVYLKSFSKFGFSYAIDILFINISVIVMTVIISHFSFKYYESYFLKLKQRISIREKFK